MFVRHAHRVLAMFSVPVCLLLSGCEAKEIKVVQSGEMEICPRVEIGQLVDGYMGDVKWEAKSIDQGKLVTATGSITYGGKSVQATLGFKVNGEQFELTDYVMDSASQDPRGGQALFAAMCRRLAPRAFAAGKARLAAQKQAATKPKAAVDVSGSTSHSKPAVSVSGGTSHSKLAVDVSGGTSHTKPAVKPEQGQANTAE